MSDAHPLVEVFISYAHQDEAYCDHLEQHLARFVLQGELGIWHDRKIVPGAHWNEEIDKHLGSADLILPLLSPDFIVSEHHREVEVPRAMERHRAGEAVVLPILLRPCDWQWMPLGEIQPLPANGTPITRWPDRDEALLDVVRGIERAIEPLRFGNPILIPGPANEPAEIPTPRKMAGEPPYDVIIAYSDQDRALREELAKHLVSLEEQGLIQPSYDSRASSNNESDDEVDRKVESADLILPLVSANFMVSDYWDVEMARALERHRAGEAVVLPILLRPCDVSATPLEDLQILPLGGKAVISWADHDEAFLDIVRGIREIIDQPSQPRPELPGLVQRLPGRRAKELLPGKGPLEAFISYAFEDESLCAEMDKHLATLEYQSVVRFSRDRQILTGVVDEIGPRIESADLILALLSAAYISSDHCRDEMSRALERHRAGEAVVLPVVLRPCDWMGWLPAELQVLPKDNKPVTRWEDRDEAFFDVVRGIREVIDDASQPESPRLTPTKPRSQQPTYSKLATEKTHFDVLLSHNSSDKPTVRQLAAALRERGLEVWFDEWELVPGRSWVQAIEEAIDTISTAAVLVGKDGIGPWERREMEACLLHLVERELPVIPVLLPGAPGEPQLPLFLKTLTWVDLRQGFAIEDLDRLAWGITGEKPDQADPSSSSQDERSRELSQTLEAAYQREEDLASSGKDTTLVREEILRLRRLLREGSLMPGESLLEGRIKLIKTVGQGGFAQVWQAWDRQSRKLVAVKVLHHQFAEDGTRRQRFFRGARQMARLQHQRIVPVLVDQAEDGGNHFFVMEFLSGGDLRAAILRGGLSRHDRLRIVLEVGEALEYAHDRGVIHRDVKPANVLLTASDRAKITDFDLVRAHDTTGGTRTGMMGSVFYAAPEAMVRAKDADARVDVFGLGMTTAFILHGADLGPEVLRDAPGFVERLSLSKDACAVLIKSMAWERENRWASVADFCRALRSLIDKNAVFAE